MAAGEPGFGPEQVRKIALLARLSLGEWEAERYAGQLGVILGHMEALRRVPTEGVTETFHAPAGGNAWRADEVRPSLPVEEVLRNAPAREQDFIRVPAVMGD